MNWIILRFILLGPGIGSFVFVAINYMTDYHSTTSTSLEVITEFIFGTTVMGMFGLVLAYPIATLPAAVCGLMYWFTLKKYTSTNFSLTLRMLVGGLIGLACTSLYGGMLFQPKENGLQSLLSWAVSGALSSACCALSIGKSTYEQST